MGADHHFKLLPNDDMFTSLRADYEAMKVMIFGDAPTFEAIIESVAKVEHQLNAI